MIRILLETFIDDNKNAFNIFNNKYNIHLKKINFVL